MADSAEWRGRFRREELAFSSGSDCCAVWLYWPAVEEEAVPCIVMAHGIGGTRDAGLEPYAERFAAEGFAVLVFDYRHFGDSGGEPRQLFSVKRQLQDWRSAVEFACSRPGIDPERIALWGVSFSGGHVVLTAADDARIAAVSALVPLLDGLGAMRAYVRNAGWGRLLQFTGMAVWDQLRGLFGLSPITVPVVDVEEGLAVLPGREAAEGCLAITPPDWPNRIAPRFGLTLVAFRPVKRVKALSCPVLMQICERDQLVDNTATQHTAELLGDQARLVGYPCDHFGMYRGEIFEKTLRTQLDFFKRNTCG